MIPINKTHIRLAPLPDDEGKKTITVLLKSTYVIQDTGSVQPLDAEAQPDLMGDQNHGDDLGRSLYYPSDMVDYKPLIDLIVRGSCHPPRGQAVQRCDVSVTLGGRAKRLTVFGNRYWRGHDESGLSVTEPEPFTEMPLRWENSFGGLTNPANPMGKGMDPSVEDDPDNPLTPLPNIENPEELIRFIDDRPRPVCFAPIPEYWEPREKKAGTRDARWATFRAPDPPQDFDERFFNSAPDDQQFKELIGGESIGFENIHPRHPHFAVRLPGERPRVFYVLAEDKERSLREVPVCMDTVVVDFVEDHLTLLWRGRLHHGFEDPVQSIDYLYLVAEGAEEPEQPLEALQVPFMAGIAPFETALAAQRDFTPEKVEAAHFGPAKDQTVKALKDAKAEPEIIAEVSAATDSTGLSESLERIFDEKAGDYKALLKDIKAKYGIED